MLLSASVSELGVASLPHSSSLLVLNSRGSPSWLTEEDEISSIVCATLAESISTKLTSRDTCACSAGCNLRA